MSESTPNETKVTLDDVYDYLEIHNSVFDYSEFLNILSQSIISDLVSWQSRCLVDYLETMSSWIGAKLLLEHELPYSLQNHDDKFYGKIRSLISQAMVLGSMQ